jgi:surface polysaccharide O-acyltransferase-like enzyme
LTRRLFLLNGLAILVTVCGHATGWGFIAMFQWADRYRPVAVPNYDQVGSLPYYVLLAIKCLSAFSVPAFLFVSGFFVAYSARGSQSAPSWRMVRVRLQNLLVPYLIWSVVIFVGDALQGVFYAPSEYISRLALGGAHPVYFYVPLICQFYLLSPWVVPIAKTRPRRLLLGSALLQLAVLSLRYPIVFGADLPTLHRATDLLFPMYAFFFAAGVVSGSNLRSFKLWLSKAKWYLLVAVIVLGALAMGESELVYRLTGLRRGGGPTAFSSSLYAAALVLCWLAFEQVAPPFSKALYQLSRAVFGIYLLHPKVLEFVARAVQEFTPWILAHQSVFQPVLVISAIMGPLLFMTIISKSPARRFYHYLFG